MARSARTSRKGRPLEEIRARIDEIDSRLLRLLGGRARLARAVGEVKRGDGDAVYQPGRERAVIERMIGANPGPLSGPQVARIFTEIISACRALERPLRVAYLGPEHTYTHAAALGRFGASATLVAEPSSGAVFSALDNGRADFGVVAVENSTEGSVTLTLDLLIDTRLEIIGEILMPIRHSLMSRSGEPAAIRRILSHQQSLAQCRAYLAANYPRCEQEAVASNAEAARRAAADAGSAAIASAEAAAAYGLQIVAEGIQDMAQNATRFLVVGHHSPPPSGRDKTSLLLAVPDRVGALNRVLSLFARNSINISKIESRPMRLRPWEYLFFLDVAGHRNEERLRRALRALHGRTLFLKVLGSYPEAR